MTDYLEPLRQAARAFHAADDRTIAGSTLADAVVHFINAQHDLTIMDRLTQAFSGRDHDPLSDIIVSVLVAHKDVEKTWIGKSYPGEPSVTNYAARVIRELQQRYDI